MKKTKQEQLIQVQNRFSHFVEILDTLEPEDIDIEEIDRLLAMLDEIEKSLQQLQ